MKLRLHNTCLLLEGGFLEKKISSGQKKFQNSDKSEVNGAKKCPTFVMFSTKQNQSLLGLQLFFILVQRP